MPVFCSDFAGELCLYLVVHNLYGYRRSPIWFLAFGYGLVAHMVVNKAKGWEEVIMFD
jgi:hypothetical protein